MILKFSEALLEEKKQARDLWRCTLKVEKLQHVKLKNLTYLHAESGMRKKVKGFYKSHPPLFALSHPFKPLAIWVIFDILVISMILTMLEILAMLAIVNFCDFGTFTIDIFQSITQFGTHLWNFRGSHLFSNNCRYINQYIITERILAWDDYRISETKDKWIWNYLCKYLVLRFIQRKLGRHDLYSHAQGGRLDDPFGDVPPASGSPVVVVQLPERLGPAARVSRASTLPGSSPPHLIEVNLG